MLEVLNDVRSGLLAPCLLILAGCAASPVQHDPFAGLYGNRWIAYSDEGMSHFQVNADKTWSGHFASRGGFDMRGVWVVRDGRICFTAPETPPGREHCDAGVAGKKVGDTWVSVDDGEEHVNVIRKGSN